MDIRQSSHYSRYMKSLGWQVENAGGAKVFIRHFPIFSYWSVIKVQRPENVDFKKLDEIAKKHHSLFVKIEPIPEFRIQNSEFRKDNWPLLPTKTLILDISATLGEFFEKLPKDTRYDIKQAMKRKIQVEESEEIELFYKLLQETMKIGKWSVPIHREVVNLWKSFQPNNSQLLLAYQGSDPVGGCLLIWNGDTAHYMFAALTRQGRANRAAYLTLFTAIEYLKKKGIRYLDLEGIYDDRFPSHTKNWQGFTLFKMGWGGKIKEYSGSYTKYSNWVIKKLFSLA